MHQRFEILKEPSDTWAVFDTVEEVPAELDGKTLIGLSHEEACLALFHLNVEVLRSSLDHWTRKVS